MAVPLIFVLAALAGVWVVFVAPARLGDGHRLTIVVPDATNLLKGTEVREGASKKVGVVERLGFADGDRAARVGLLIGDDAWPLPKGTTVSLRTGGTVSATNRYLELRRPRRVTATLADGAQIPSREVTVPVEFDALLRLFDRSTRGSLKRFLDSGGRTASLARAPLADALVSSPPALDQTRRLLADVASDLPALDRLVLTADHVVNGVRRADPGLASLVQGAGTTFAAAGRQSSALKDALAQLPPTLTQSRQTLARTDATLGATTTLVGDLAPAVRQLRAVAPQLDTTLRSLKAVAPAGTRTLRTLRRAAPDISSLLGTLREQAPTYTGIGRGATAALRCLRPYTPELGGFASTWASMTSNHDGRDRIARVQVGVVPAALTTSSPYSPAQAVAAFPGLRYAFPAPPGLNAGQPWFQPKCGAGPDALDPSKDPETHPRSGGGR